MSRAHFFRNTGKPFEKEISNIAGLYEDKGILTLEKVDPPTITKRDDQVIFLRNPFLDFVGTWTERGGRALFLEAKSTEEPRLSFGKGGITQRQIDNLNRWARAGAAVGVLWECCGYVRFISRKRLALAIETGNKSFELKETTPVIQGVGFILYDYVENLRKAYPLANAGAGPAQAAMGQSGTVQGDNQAADRSPKV